MTQTERAVTPTGGTGDPSMSRAIDDPVLGRRLLPAQAAKTILLPQSRNFDHGPLPDIADTEAVRRPATIDSPKGDRLRLDPGVLPDQVSTIPTTNPGVREVQDDLDLNLGPLLNEAAASDHAAEAPLTQICLSRGIFPDPAALMGTVTRGATMVIHLD